MNTSSQEALEKMLEMIGHESNGNQSHPEKVIHTYWNGQKKKVR